MLVQSAHLPFSWPDFHNQTIEIKLPLSRSVLPESRPFEVTNLWRGEGVRKREYEVCDRGGEDEGINVWSFEDFDTGEWLATDFGTWAPIRAGEFIITIK